MPASAELERGIGPGDEVNQLTGWRMILEVTMEDDVTDAGSGEPQAADPVAVAVARCDGPAVTKKPGPKRPWLYTPERVHELAVSLGRYFDATDSLFVETWACTEGLHMRQIHRLAQGNEELRPAFERASTVQASRLLEGSTRPMDTATNRIA
jgi:hypothetical protein